MTGAVTGRTQLATPVAAGITLTLALVSCALPLVRRATITDVTRLD